MAKSPTNHVFIPTGWLDSDDVNLWSSPMTFHFWIRCKGGSIQMSEIPCGMNNSEWNIHLMGHHCWTCLQLSALLLCFFYPFHFLLVPVILHVFPTLSLHFLPSQVSRLDKPRSTVWCPKDRKRCWPKRRQLLTSSISEASQINAATVGIFPAEVTSNIVALAFSVQHFLAVGTLEKKVPGKEKHTKNTVSVCKGRGNIGPFLDHQSSSWF